MKDRKIKCHANMFEWASSSLKLKHLDRLKSIWYESVDDRQKSTARFAELFKIVNPRLTTRERSTVNFVDTVNVKIDMLEFLFYFLEFSRFKYWR